MIGDHPRACGAHSHQTAQNHRQPGSSPRMRGSHAVKKEKPDDIGIIPAHAGLTWKSRDNGHFARDHPRACGAHMSRAGSRRLQQGSSPRMRGSPGQMPGQKGVKGIIPAYAGLTSAFLSLSSRYGDHPRVCGAHIPMDALYLKVSGSSPRMRGSLGRRAGSVLDGGIIPAYAGLTYRISKLPSLFGDHPRVCGAHVTYRVVAI